MIKCACELYRKFDFLRSLSNDIGAPLLNFVIRLYMADVFFKSGWRKFKNFLNDDWGSTVFLFEEIHPVPGFSAELAAVLGTGGEIILPVLLALGLFGRVGAAGLIVMTIVIQFLVPADYGMANADHYMWLMLLAVPFVHGPGTFSLDHLLRRWIARKRHAV